MSQLSPLTSYKDIGNRKDVRGLAVLRASKRPAVIVEALSITAPTERAQLLNTQAQKKYAQAIVRGIARYKHVAYKPLPSTTPTTPPVSSPPTATPAPAPKVSPVMYKAIGYDI